MSGFKNQLLSGIIWTTFQMVINRGFKFIIKLILARILFPEDYGLVGMAVVFTSIIGVFNEIGMGAALVQRREEELNEDHFNTAFWIGVIWAVFLYLIIGFIIGPIAASFYEEPLLKEIIPVLSLGVLTSPINTVHKSQLIRELKFKKIALISNISNILSGSLALVLALTGAGVWSLVFNSVVSLVITVPLFFWATKWVPSFSFSKKAFKDIFGFGIYTTGTKLFGKIIGQFDYLIVGKILGAASLGIYSLAFLLTDILRHQITHILHQVLYPLFSKLQDKPKQLKGYYLKIVKTNAFIIYPIIFGLILFSEELIPLMFGNKWTETIPVLNILCIGVIIDISTASSSIFFRASGDPDLEWKIISINALFFYIPLVTLGTVLFDVEGTALGYCLSVLFSSIHILMKMEKRYKIRILDALNTLKKPFVISILPFSILFILSAAKIFWIIEILLYVIGIGAMIFTIAKEDFMDVVNTLKNRDSQKKKAKKMEGI